MDSMPLTKGWIRLQPGVQWLDRCGVFCIPHHPWRQPVKYNACLTHLGRFSFWDKRRKRWGMARRKGFAFSKNTECLIFPYWKLDTLHNYCCSVVHCFVSVFCFVLLAEKFLNDFSDRMYSICSSEYETWGVTATQEKCEDNFKLYLIPTGKS